MALSLFRVVIVGGGVSGLTLASALEKGNVDYILLEGRDQFAPYVGASIAITANGGRILDQLDCWDIIAQKTMPMNYIRSWKDGKLTREQDSVVFGHKRSGYPFVFMDRHFLLQTLYTSVEDKSKLLLNKRVCRVDHGPDGITVQCRDGSTYVGHVVVGADGVHSMVRHEMWRHMDVAQPGLLPACEKTKMTAEYKCMFGVSRPTPGLEHGPFNQVLGHDLSFLHSLDKDGRVFWFIFEKMDKLYTYPHFPQYSDDDAVALANRCLKVGMTDRVKFADLWDNRISYKLVPLEEAWFQHWCWGRFLCIGDGIHKWTPNIGQGGNNAIETAATAANAIYKLVAGKNKTPSADDVATALATVPERRKPRAKAMFDISIMITRLEALKGPMEALILLHLLPKLGDYIVNQISLSIVGSEKIDYLPDPPKSLAGTMAFNQNYGPGTSPRYLKRFLTSFPFLVSAYFCRCIFSGILAQPALLTTVRQFVDTGRIQYGDLSWSLPTRVSPFDLLVSVFSPSLLGIDTTHRLQCIAFLTDIGPLWLIWMLEAHRRANTLKFISFPLVFGIAFQMYGIGVVCPVYCFLHYVQSPLADYAALDWRLVNVAAAKTAAAAVTLAFVLPLLAMYLLPDLGHRLGANAVWQAFPVVTVLLHYVLRKTVVKDTTMHDRVYNVDADLPSIRLSVGAFAAFSALAFNWVRFTASASLSEIFLPRGGDVRALLLSHPTMLDLVSGMKLFLQVDEIFCFTSVFLWLAYLTWDLKQAEMTTISWLQAVSTVVLGTLAVGPGAVVAAVWLWRERILSTRKAKGSVGVTYLRNGV